MVQDVYNSAVLRSRVDRAIGRRDAIGLAILVALGLTSSDAGQRLAGAASRGGEVVRVAKRYKGARYK